MKSLKTLLWPSLIVSLVLLSTCSSEKEGDLNEEPDCAGSSLSIQVIEVVDETCDVQGSITVEASGGEGVLLFAIDGGTPGSATTFSGLSAGNYTITVIDGIDCTASVDAQVMAEDGSITVDLTINSQAGCETSEGSITATATGGDGDYTYSIDGGTFGTENTFTGLSAGEHTVVAKDGSGCESSDAATLESGVSLETDIMPIISTNCAVSGCHADTRSPNLNTSEQIIGSAERIQARTSAGTMPPAGRPDLTDDEIALISCWVEDGAQNN